MGRFLVAVILAGCTHAATTSPAWPKQSTPDKDGGESLAPHESKQLNVAVEKSDEETKPEPKVEAKPAVVPAAAETGGTVTAPAVTQPTEETITTEDIIIEIDD
jgi:hypothetical protein